MSKVYRVADAIRGMPLRGAESEVTTWYLSPPDGEALAVPGFVPGDLYSFAPVDEGGSRSTFTPIARMPAGYTASLSASIKRSDSAQGALVQFRLPEALVQSGDLTLWMPEIPQVGPRPTCRATATKCADSFDLRCDRALPATSVLPQCIGLSWLQHRVQEVLAAETLRIRVPELVRDHGELLIEIGIDYEVGHDVERVLVNPIWMMPLDIKRWGMRRSIEHIESTHHCRVIGIAGAFPRNEAGGWLVPNDQLRGTRAGNLGRFNVDAWEVDEMNGALTAFRATRDLEDPADLLLYVLPNLVGKSRQYVAVPGGKAVSFGVSDDRILGVRLQMRDHLSARAESAESTHPDDASTDQRLISRHELMRRVASTSKEFDQWGAVGFGVRCERHICDGRFSDHVMLRIGDMILEPEDLVGISEAAAKGLRTRSIDGADVEVFGSSLVPTVEEVSDNARDLIDLVCECSERVASKVRTDDEFIVEQVKQCVELALQRLAQSGDRSDVSFDCDKTALNPRDTLRCGQSRLPCLVGAVARRPIRSRLGIRIKSALPGGRVEAHELVRDIGWMALMVVPMDCSVTVEIVDGGQTSLGSTRIDETVLGPVSYQSPEALDCSSQSWAY